MEIKLTKRSVIKVTKYKQGVLKVIFLEDEGPEIEVRQEDEVLVMDATEAWKGKLSITENLKDELFQMFSTKARVSLARFEDLRCAIAV